MKRHISLILVLAILALSGCRSGKPASNEAAEQTPAPTMQNVVTGTGMLEPETQYTICASVMGDVLAADFEEGQTVTEGTPLYVLNQSDLLANIDKARVAVERSELAKRQTQDSLAKQTVRSKTSGTVTKLYVAKGGTIAQGAPVCDIVNDAEMILKIPFLENDAKNMTAGQSASVSLVGTFFTVNGSVSKVTNGHMVSASGSEVRMVEISVPNPGTIKKDDKATAAAGSFACADIGTFDYASSETVTSEGMGKIENVAVSVGDYVSGGAALASLDTSALKTANEQNDLAIKDARLSLQSLMDKQDDYTVKAPVTGTITAKHVKKGDTISQVNMANLAAIADLTKIRFKMSVDEIDVTKIKVGQSVSFTPEATPDKEYFGTVSYIADTGTKTGDATLYEVRVSVSPAAELKAGMNVLAKIILD